MTDDRLVASIEFGLLELRNVEMRQKSGQIMHLNRILFTHSAANRVARSVSQILAIVAVFTSVATADHGDQKASLSDPTAPADHGVSQISYSVTQPEQVFKQDHSGGPEVQMAEDAGHFVLPPIEPFESDANHTFAPQTAPPAESVISIPSVDDLNSQEFKIESADDDDDDDDKHPRNFHDDIREPYQAYRSYQSNLSWIPGSANSFGLLEWSTEPYLDRDDESGFTGAINITWLRGPTTIPLSPRLYDFSFGYQKRQQWTPTFSFDLAASIGIFSDFEGSARDGVRFPAHAVGMFHLNHLTDLVFGADFLDREDISVLPVFGLSLRSDRCPQLRMDLIFPRPKVEYNLSPSKRLYLAGQLGGGTWDVDNGVDLVATYRDYRLMLGFESADSDGSTSGLEFGYVFDRQIELRGQQGQTQFDDAFMLRWVSRK